MTHPPHRGGLNPLWISLDINSQGVYNIGMDNKTKTMTITDLACEYDSLCAALVGADGLDDVRFADAALREWDVRCDRASDELYRDARAAGHTGAIGQAWNGWRSDQRGIWSVISRARLELERARAEGPVAVARLEHRLAEAELVRARTDLGDLDPQTREYARDAVRFLSRYCAS